MDERSTSATASSGEGLLPESRGRAQHRTGVWGLIACNAVMLVYSLGYLVYSCIPVGVFADAETLEVFVVRLILQLPLMALLVVSYFVMGLSQRVLRADGYITLEAYVRRLKAVSGWIGIGGLSACLVLCTASSICIDACADGDDAACRFPEGDDDWCLLAVLVLELCGLITTQTLILRRLILHNVSSEQPDAEAYLGGGHGTEARDTSTRVVEIQDNMINLLRHKIAAIEAQLADGAQPVAVRETGAARLGASVVALEAEIAEYEHERDQKKAVEAQLRARNAELRGKLSKSA